ncbi:MAG: hypothetical protein HY754_02655 [Nitrospirae bacterium]|nr:hypothetical protein [Nitrospirota bacterium]
MPQVLSIELYQLLEEKLGKEEAKKVASAIEIGLDVIEKKAEAVALQKKLELKDELTKELATKADIAKLEGEIQTVRQEIQTVKVDIEGKLRLYFLMLLFVIILVSPKAIDLIGKFLGVIK